MRVVREVGGFAALLIRGFNALPDWTSAHEPMEGTPLGILFAHEQQDGEGAEDE